MKKAHAARDRFLSVLLAVLSVAWIYPVVMILLNSLKKETAISTGTAFELLGSSITDASGREYPALGFSKFTVQETDARITGDVICQCAQIKEPVVGFVNKCTLIKGIEAPLFTVSMGPGNQAGDPREGLCLGNVFGTHLTGPILVKNPSFLDYITDLLGKRQQPQFELSPMDNPHPLRAYEITLQELTKRRDGV